MRPSCPGQGGAGPGRSRLGQHGQGKRPGCHPETEQAHPTGALALPGAVLSPKPQANARPAPHERVSMEGTGG